MGCYFSSNKIIPDSLLKSIYFIFVGSELVVDAYNSLLTKSCLKKIITYRQGCGDGQREGAHEAGWSWAKGWAYLW